MAEKIIEIKHLSKSFGDKSVLKDINLYINKGEFITLLGPSGCGKTTLLRMIAGFLQPDEGSILLGGKELAGTPPHLRPLNTVFQRYALFPHLDVYDNIAFGLKLKKVPEEEIEKRVRRVLKLVAMSDYEDRDVETLSGGQQQRIAIARSLLLKPSLLLLDEPFSALDAKIRQQMREELKKIQSDLGITVIFVTHDQEEAMSLSHRIVVMNKGKFEQVGTPAEIYDSPKTLHVASFIGEMNFIKKGEKTIAVRPENVSVRAGSGDDLDGTVRTIMLLGHYVVLNVQCGENVVKCNVDRELSDRLHIGDPVTLTFNKYSEFDTEAGFTPIAQ